MADLTPHMDDMPVGTVLRGRGVNDQPCVYVRIQPHGPLSFRWCVVYAHGSTYANVPFDGAVEMVEKSTPPPANLGGTDWDWTDVEGNELTISGDGAVMCDAADDWVDLDGRQWAQVAAVAALMSDRLTTMPGGAS